MKFSDHFYSGMGLLGCVVGVLSALPVYTMLAKNLRIPPNMYFLTIAMGFAGWLVFAAIDALIDEIFIRRRS